MSYFGASDASLTSQDFYLQMGDATDDAIARSLFPKLRNLSSLSYADATKAVQAAKDYIRSGAQVPSDIPAIIAKWDAYTQRLGVKLAADPTGKGGGGGGGGIIDSIMSLFGAGKAAAQQAGVKIPGEDVQQPRKTDSGSGMGTIALLAIGGLGLWWLSKGKKGGSIVKANRPRRRNRYRARRNRRVRAR